MAQIVFNEERMVRQVLKAWAGTEARQIERYRQGFHYREYGACDPQDLRVVLIPGKRNEQQKPCYSHRNIGRRWEATVKRAGIRRRNPYHTRHTFACWLLSAGANPSFIANQMGHENAKMVYEVYST